MTSQKRLAAAYLLLALLLVILFAANIFWGSVALTPGAVVSALLGRGQDALSVGIITQLRLPRAVMVVLLGAALSAAGYLLQTFFANPIAGPFVMGISSGAKLAVALVMVVFLNRGLLTNSVTLILAAFAGAMAAMAFVLAVARRVQRMSILVICGIMIGYICSAITEFVVAFAQDSNIVNLHNWSQGSFSGMTWGNVRAAALVVLPVLAAAFCLSKPMSAYQMGKPMPRASGSTSSGFPARWFCFPACWPPVSPPLPGPSPLWALRYPTSSSSCWAAQSPSMSCRGAASAARRSVCSVTSSPAACSPPPSFPSAR